MILPPVCVLYSQDEDLRRRARQYERLEMLLARLHVDRVLVGAGNDVRAAADHRFEGPRAAREVADAHIQPFVLEVAEPLGERQRQVVERGPAADRDMHIRLLDLRVRDWRKCERHGEQQRAHESSYISRRLSSA